MSATFDLCAGTLQPIFWRRTPTGMSRCCPHCGVLIGGKELKRGRKRFATRVTPPHAPGGSFWAEKLIEVKT